MCIRDRAGHTKTCISSTGYDEAMTNSVHSPLAQLRDTIRAASSNTQPTAVTTQHVKLIEAIQEGSAFDGATLHGNMAITFGP